MTRVFGADEEGSPRIDPEAVATFFDSRAERIAELGPTRAVIYQDNHPDLAERRDETERQTLLPLLELRPDSRLLDVGCGTGRWVETVAQRVRAYHGVDLTAGLIDYARKAHTKHTNARFSVASVDGVGLDVIGETEGFDRVLMAGVLIYLNDDQLERALKALAGVLEGRTPRVLAREPVAQSERLSIVEHFSEELNSTYNAIYRTEPELLEAFARAFGPAGLDVIDRGFVFEESSGLNNRPETKQEWFVIGRRYA